jgi:hypothetical protein
MILDNQTNVADNEPTLDHLFRRAGVRHPDRLALADPPNRASFTEGAPRRLSYAQADRAISALAARLRGFGLQTDTVVGLHLANTVELVIAVLGVLRAGMIAAPLPLLWRRTEIVAALGQAGAKTIITAARIGPHAHAETAMQTAAELFPIRYVGAFGADPPDGAIPLDAIFETAADFIQPVKRRSPAAAHVATITFDMTTCGVIPVPRSHADLIASGAATFRAAGLSAGAPLLSTIPPSSFAGIATAMVPWLEAGGTLHLHHGFDPDTFASQCSGLDSAGVVLPGPAVAALQAAGVLERAGAVIALWRAPAGRMTAPAWQGKAVLVDVAATGEAGLAIARRGENDGFAGAEATPGVVHVGGYRFSLADLERVVAEADPAAALLAVPDALLGDRLAGSAADPEHLRATLEDRHLSPLISGAFRPRARHFSVVVDGALTAAG